MNDLSLVQYTLGEKIKAYCEANHISGIIRITHKDTILFEQAFGFADVDDKTPFTKDSMFTLYSLSKPFCAIGLLLLKDKDLVDIDSHPSRYVPEAEGFDEHVTIRHLLHHISGLPDFEQNKDFADKHAPGYGRYIRKHLALLTAYPPYFPPGTNARYANINFVLCALIIENVSGMKYAEYMRQEVFHPLGMTTAVIDNETMVIPHRVCGYTLQDDTLCKTTKSHNWLLGAGDIVATVDDVYCLNKAIKYRLLLKEETWREILTPSPLNSMGMGCTVSIWHGKKRVTHNGGHDGFRTLHIQLPKDDFDIILLSNSGFGNARNDIAEMIHDAFYGDDGTDTESVKMDQGYIHS